MLGAGGVMRTAPTNVLCGVNSPRGTGVSFPGGGRGVRKWGGHRSAAEEVVIQAVWGHCGEEIERGAGEAAVPRGGRCCHGTRRGRARSEGHTSELQSRENL